jgi:hypothetical protein
LKPELKAGYLFQASGAFMDEQNLYTVLTTVAAVLGSSAAWKYWEKRLAANQKKELMLERDRSELKDDLRERVAVLENKLLKAEEEKDKLRQEIISLVEKIAALTVEVEYLRRENQELRMISHPPMSLPKRYRHDGKEEEG